MYRQVPTSSGSERSVSDDKVNVMWDGYEFIRWLWLCSMSMQLYMWLWPYWATDYGPGNRYHYVQNILLVNHSIMNISSQLPKTARICVYLAGLFCKTPHFYFATQSRQYCVVCALGTSHYPPRGNSDDMNSRASMYYVLQYGPLPVLHANEEDRSCQQYRSQ
jgi:hypothetical protein